MTDRTAAGTTFLRSMLGKARQDARESEGDEAHRVFVNPVGLTPWLWGGVRGEVFVAMLAILVLMGGLLHWFVAAAVLAFCTLIVGKLLTRWHPYWPEMALRLLVQPIGFLDT